MQERVRPNGSHRAVRAKKTGSCRRPHTEAHPWPVWGALVCHHQRGWAAHGAPPLVALGAAPMTHLQRLRTPSLDLDLLGMEVLQDAMIHRVQVRCRLFHALSTVVGPCPGRLIDVAGLSRNASLHTPYHTWLLLPRLASGIVPSPLCWSCANTGFCTETPLDVVYGVATCINLLQNRKQWQLISATGGPMVLGYARVSKGEEQDTRMQETA